MKKILLSALLLILLAVCLVLLNKNSGGDAPPDNTAAPVVFIADNPSILSIDLGNMTFQNNGGNWIIEGYEDVPLNESSLNIFINTFSSLSAHDVINSGADKQEFGLLNPQAKAFITYESGEALSLCLGDLTADGQYYYLLRENDGNIYLITKTLGNRFFYTLNDVIDKSLPEISWYEPTLINIVQKGRDEILIEFEGNRADGNESMFTLTMKKPIDGALVYPPNLEESLLYNLKALQLISLAEASCNDLEKYGLSEPFLELNLADMDNTLNLQIGDSADDNSYYCKKTAENHVYTISKKAVQPFIDADIYKFIQRFVAFHMKNELESVSIIGHDEHKNWSITFEKEENDIRNFIDGQEIDGELFNPFYELLTGISFDRVDYALSGAGKSPVLTIIYKSLDGYGTETVCEYYEYNPNFYAVSKNGMKIYIVNKQSVRSMLESLDNITASTKGNLY